MRRRISVALVCCGVLAGSAGVAYGQSDPAAPGERGKALIILDGSKSMNKPAGDGGTRLDAAKEATRELADQIPTDSDLGLRVYGSEVAGVDRAQACRDTKLAFPVGPTDRGDIRSTVDGLRGVGRTPIGRSLLAAPDDLGSSGRRVVVLISDGGDNCAPPDPCEAAEEVSRRGLDLTVSVVGLQVSSPRVREQLECIARAGGGSYVDVEDVAQLSGQVQALFLRALRTYEPAGQPVTGSTDAKTAPLIKPGQYLTKIGANEHRFFAVDVPKGERAVVVPTFINKNKDGAAESVEAELIGPRGRSEDYLNSTGSELLSGRSPDGFFDGFEWFASSPVTSSVAGSEDADVAGRYLINLSSEVPAPVDVELAVDVGGREERIDWTDGAAQPPGTTAPAKAANDQAETKSGGGGGSALAILVTVSAGLLVGLALALTLTPRRIA